MSICCYKSHKIASHSNRVLQKCLACSLASVTENAIEQNLIQFGVIDCEYERVIGKENLRRGLTTTHRDCYGRSCCTIFINLHASYVHDVIHTWSQAVGHGRKIATSAKKMIDAKLL